MFHDVAFEKFNFTDDFLLGKTYQMAGRRYSRCWFPEQTS